MGTWMSASKASKTGVSTKFSAWRIRCGPVPTAPAVRLRSTSASPVSDNSSSTLPGGAGGSRVLSAWVLARRKSVVVVKWLFRRALWARR